MDKKQLTAVVDALVKATAEKLGLEEGEARTMVGITLKKNTAALLAAIGNPTLTVTGNPA